MKLIHPSKEAGLGVDTVGTCCMFWLHLWNWRQQSSCIWEWD